MGYTVVKSFERGIDTRRIIDSIEAGGLIDAIDCHVTRGGEIEKRAAFVRIRGLPPNSKGLHVMPGLTFHVWGTDATALPIESLEAGGVYHQIPHPDGYALENILCVEEFQTKLYVIAQYAGGHIAHWWGGTTVGGLDFTLITPYTGPGTVIIPEDPLDPPEEVPPPPEVPTGAKPKVSYNLYWPVPPPNATDPTDPGWRVPFISFAWLLKPGSKFKFSGATQDAWSIVNIGGYDSQGKPYYSGTTISQSAESNIAAEYMKAINENTTPLPIPIKATASGTQLTVFADDVGITYNGWTIRLGGQMSFYPNATQVLSGGLNRETTTFFGQLRNVEVYADEADSPLLLGSYACAHNLKMYTVNGSRLNISMLKNPMRWDDAEDAIGAGFIEMDMIAEGTPILISMADYQDMLAIFGLRHIFLWRMDADPVANYKVQILHRTGLVGPHAQIPYGEGDIMYLDRSGIRSLRVHSGVDEAYASDLGTMIDPLVRAKIETSTEADRLLKFWAEIEPHSGRLWMALRDRIFVLSYYPANKVSAWTIYDASDCPVDYMNATQDGLYWRSGNDLMCYAGENNNTYDGTEALVRIPYIDGGKPATTKNWAAVDIAATGNWQVRASFDPTQPTAFDLIANITKSSYAQQKIAMNGQSPSVSLEFRTHDAARVILSNCAVHYDDAYAD